MKRRQVVKFIAISLFGQGVSKATNLTKLKLFLNENLLVGSLWNLDNFATDRINLIIITYVLQKRTKYATINRLVKLISVSDTTGNFNRLILELWEHVYLTYQDYTDSIYSIPTTTKYEHIKTHPAIQVDKSISRRLRYLN